MVGKPKGKESLERPRRRRDSNIKRDIKDICWVAMFLTDVAEDGDKLRAVVNAVMYLQVP